MITKSVIGLGAVFAGLTSVVATSMILVGLSDPTNQEEDYPGFEGPVGPVMYSTEFPPSAADEAKMNELYGPVNQEALNEEKHGIIRNLFRRKSCLFSRVALRRQSRLSCPSCQPSSPYLRPYVGPSPQPIQPSPPAIEPDSGLDPVIIESEVLTPVFIETL